MKKLILAVLSAFVLLTACNVQKRQIRQLDGLVLQQPIEFARLSNLLNPCFSGKAKSDTITKIDTTIFKGDTSVFYSGFKNAPYYGRGIDTLIFNDNMPNMNWPLRDTITKTIKITLPGKIINRLVTIHDTIADNRALAVINNTYKVKSDSLIIVKTQLAQVHKSKNIWMWIAIGLMVVFIVVIAIKVYSFFSGGALKKLI